MKHFMWLSVAGLSLSVEGCTLQSRQARIHQNISLDDMQLWKRDYFNTRWTYYDVGLGACGKTNGPSDFIVALNSEQFDVGGGYPGPQCFKFITMKYKGKTAKAQIMDRCPGCPYGGLDLSEGLFSHFSDLGEGVLSGSWSFTSTGPEDEDDNSTIHEHPTSTYPTSTYHSINATKIQTPSPNSNPHYEITTTDSNSFTTVSSSTPVTAYSIPSSSAVPIPTGISNEQGENIDNINVVLIGLAELLFAGLHED